MTLSKPFITRSIVSPCLTPHSIVSWGNNNIDLLKLISTLTCLSLRRYLDDSCGKPPIVLHVLRGKVDLKLADALGASSKSEALKRMENETQALLQDQNAEDKSKQEKTLETLRRLTAEFRTPLPTTCLLKLQNSSSTFTCSKVSLEGATKLITGTEASALHVWNLVRSSLNVHRPLRLLFSSFRCLKTIKEIPESDEDYPGVQVELF